MRLLHEFPQELLAIIFSNFGPLELLSVRQTCRSFKSAAWGRFREAFRKMSTSLDSGSLARFEEKISHNDICSQVATLSLRLGQEHEIDDTAETVESLTDGTTVSKLASIISSIARTDRSLGLIGLTIRRRDESGIVRWRSLIAAEPHRAAMVETEDISKTWLHIILSALRKTSSFVDTLSMNVFDDDSVPLPISMFQQPSLGCLSGSGPPVRLRHLTLEIDPHLYVEDDEVSPGNSASIIADNLCQHFSLQSLAVFLILKTSPGASDAATAFVEATLTLKNMRRMEIWCPWLTLEIEDLISFCSNNQDSLQDLHVYELWVCPPSTRALIRLLQMLQNEMHQLYAFELKMSWYEFYRESDACDCEDVVLALNLQEDDFQGRKNIYECIEWLEAFASDHNF